MKGIAFLPGFISSLLTIGTIFPAFSQVSSDNTTNTTVNTSGNNFNILNGIQKGNNLFHSFKEFSIPTGGSVNFQNSSAIKNIINRITGGNISNIDGLIKANGNANLFLINPAGIVFGENARLDIGGSFLGSTASSILFEDGFNYSAIVSQQTPLLTVSVPLGLQMGTNPAAITNQGALLEVKSGNTLGLIGGDINLHGGKLRLDGGGGHIYLASLDDGSQINLKLASGGWSLDSSNSESFRDIELTQETLLNASGEGSASINIAARNFTLSDNSKFQADNRGEKSGGAITINATSSILVEGSEIRTETKGSGNAADILVYAPKITLKNDGDIVSVAASGSGDAGAISIEAQEIVLFHSPDFTDSKTNGIVSVNLDKGNGSNISMIADSIIFNPGAITNFTNGEGNSGKTTLKAKTIEIFGGGGATLTRGSGNGGELNIIADTFYLDGDGGFSGSSSGNGKAANINVNAARSIIIRGDTGLGTSAFSSGNAGNINFKSDYIEIDNSEINSRTEGNGNAGNINLSGKTIRLLNGGHLNVTTKASGNGGNISIKADTVEFNGKPTTGTFSDKNTGLISSVLPDVKNPNAITGNGGNIDLTASSLVIRDGALISASTSAGAGNGGNINIDVDRFDMLNGGQVMNVTRSAGNAGTITINAGDRILVSGNDALHTLRQLAYVPGQDSSDVEYNIGAFSGIYANATQTALGNGGNLKVSGGNLRIEDEAKITVSSQGSGSAGSFNANLDILRLDGQASLEAESAAGSQGNLSFNLNQALILRRDSKITTNATGTANGGNITINSPVIAGFENSDIIANAVEGNGGNIDITTQGIFGLKFRDRVSPDSDITASSQFGINGRVEINNVNIDPGSGIVSLPSELTDSSQQVASGCSSSGDSSFVATGKGGIPRNPNQYLISNQTWSDIRDLSISGKSNNNTYENNQISNQTAIVEATGFSRNSKGEIELVASGNRSVLINQTSNYSGINT